MRIAPGMKPGRPFEPEPAWDIAYLFSPQGQWIVSGYLELPDNPFNEFSHGRIEVLPPPTMKHHLLSGHMWFRLNEFVEQGDLGMVLFGPLPVRLWPRKH